MILLVSSKDDVTTDYVVHGLQQSNHDVFRFNTEDLFTNFRVAFSATNELDKFIIHDMKRQISLDLQLVTGAYFRRPKMPPASLSLESAFLVSHVQNEVSGFLKALWSAVPSEAWLNKPLNIWKADNKLTQLRVARLLGLSIPQTCVSIDSKEVLQFNESVSGPIICKPMSHGQISEQANQIQQVFTSELSEQDIQWIAQSSEIAPSIFQQRIDKDADIRLTVVGSRIFAAEIRSQEYSLTRVDWRKAQLDQNIKLTYQKCDLPENVSASCLKLMEHLDLRFACIDLIRQPNGEHVFLEVNPNGNWVWIESQLGFPIREEIIRLLAGRG